MEANLTRKFWQYSTDNNSKLDKMARIVIEPICRLYIGASKPSHTWNYKTIEFPNNYQGILIPGDPNAHKINTPLDLLKMESRWGWQTMRVLQANLQETNDRNLKWWEYGYSTQDKSFAQVCRIPILMGEQIRIMVGPEPFWIFGMGSDMQEVPLIVSNPVQRTDPKIKSIPIF